ncbi:MAG: hypothetical protein OSB07_05215 [Dehalococcoidia bacterium]|nr:hypothetical protein [Dehalococcoidia bacterium]
MKFMTAVAIMIAEAIGVLDYREVAAKIGEMATYTEMWRHAMDGVEHGAQMGKGGVMSLGSLSGMNIYFAQTSARMVQILREVSGSGLIMQPSENDLANPELRPYLDRYMRGKGVDAEYKSRLYRMAWLFHRRVCGRRYTNTGTASTPTETTSTCCEGLTRARSEGVSKT